MDLRSTFKGSAEVERLLKERSLVIFDFDGTLFNIPADWKRGYEVLTQIGREYGHIGSFRSLSEAYNWALKIYRVKERLVQIQNEIEEEGIITRTEIRKGTSAARWRLSRGFSCAILSLNTSYTLDRVVGHWGFYPIISIDKVQRPKPDPQGLDLILDAHGLEPEEAVFIGNSNIDRETAESGSVEFIHVEDIREEWFE